MAVEYCACGSPLSRGVCTNTKCSTQASKDAELLRLVNVVARNVFKRRRRKG